MRTATETTKARIATLSAKPTKPAWLKLALHDAIHDKPMSLARERRMCAALGIDAPPNEYAVPECPGCGGEPHVAREGCNGNGGHAVVLAPNETVRKTPAPRYRTQYYRPCYPRTLTPAQRAKLMEMAKMLEGQR